MQEQIQDIQQCVAQLLAQASPSQQQVLGRMATAIEELKLANRELHSSNEEQSILAGVDNERLVDEGSPDITERKQAKEALCLSEERFRNAFDYAAIGMGLLALDGSWLKVNPSLCEIVGYSEQELLATTFESITYPDDLETDLKYIRQLLNGEIRHYQMEKRYFRDILPHQIEDYGGGFQRITSLISWFFPLGISTLA